MFKTKYKSVGLKKIPKKNHPIKNPQEWKLKAAAWAVSGGEGGLQQFRIVLLRNVLPQKRGFTQTEPSVVHSRGVKHRRLEERITDAERLSEVGPHEDFRLDDRRRFLRADWFQARWRHNGRRWAGRRQLIGRWFQLVLEFFDRFLRRFVALSCEKLNSLQFLRGFLL